MSSSSSNSSSSSGEVEMKIVAKNEPSSSISQKSNSISSSKKSSSASSPSSASKKSSSSSSSDKEEIEKSSSSSSKKSSSSSENSENSFRPHRNAATETSFEEEVVHTDESGPDENNVGGEASTSSDLSHGKDFKKKSTLDVLRQTQHKMSKPSYPIQIRMENLSYVVDVKESPAWKFWDKQYSEKRILNNITATINPGELVAIMGSSGAGKTTLLNVLSGRAKIGDHARIEGTLLFNGQKRSSKLKPLQAYIAQDDIFIPTLSVKEILEFAAALRLPQNFTKYQKEERVEELLSIFNLKQSQDTQVGAPGLTRGISGGERKRLAVAQEVIHDPALMFVDEPTSGLDSTTAELVMSTLRLFAESGRTVVCTIHQPNSTLFNLFDKLMLLAKGELLYYGKSDQVVDYFASVGYKCPLFTNPPDFFIKLIHIDHSVEKGSEKVDRLIKKYKKSKLAKSQKKVKLLNQDTPPSTHGLTPPLYIQLYWLLKRTSKDILRDRLKTTSKLIQTIILGLLIGLVYLNLDLDQAGVQSRQGALFFIAINQAMLSVVANANLFPLLKPVFFRETGNNMYTGLAFYISQVLIDIPFTMSFSILISAITYWMIGFRPEVVAFFIFTLIVVLCSAVGSSLGLMIGIIAPSGDVATALVPLFVLPFAIFSGFFINSASSPPYFLWIPYISFINYIFRALILNEFNRDVTFTCKPDEMVIVNGTAECRIPNGQAVIDNLNFDDGLTITLNIIIVLGMIVFYRFIAGACLIYKGRGTIDA